MNTALELCDVGKTFTMHLQGGIELPVVTGVEFAVRAGECVVLAGPSGAGKSSVLKMIYGSYRCDQGRILVHHGAEQTDVASASPRRMMALRRDTLGYVSQFLRAVPRVAALNVVAEPLLSGESSRDVAYLRASEFLRRLNISERLWGLPPATFSGGEQQRINIARGLLPDLPLLLLDEPTASLDAGNSKVVVDLITERKRRGTGIVAIVHDLNIRERIADRIIDMTRFSAAA